MRLTEAEYAALLRRMQGIVPPGAHKLPKKAQPHTLPLGRRREDEFAAQLDALVVPYVREFRFLPDRKFRFDFALLPLCMKLAVEIDGGVHRIDGRFRSDREKGNLALENGWRVIHLGVDEVRSKEGQELVLRALLLPASRSLQPPAIDAKKIPA